MTTNNEQDEIEINPEGVPSGTVIWLHGLGADGNDFVPVAQQLASHGLRFVFPNAPFLPVTVNQGYQMRAWYDIVSLDVDAHADQQGMQATAHRIHERLRKEIAQGVSPTNIILAGFSQGAVIALLAGLTFPDTLGGLLALSGYLPDPENTLLQTTENSRRTPVFLGHGVTDATVPCALGERVWQALKAAGHPVSWHVYPMGHSVCMEEIQDISVWLRQVLA